MPEGIKIVEAQVIDNKTPSIASSIYMADYKVTVLLKESLKTNLSDVLYNFLAQDEIIVKKKKKKKIQEVNIAPDIHSIDIKDNDG